MQKYSGKRRYRRRLSQKTRYPRKSSNFSRFSKKDYNNDVETTFLDDENNIEDQEEMQVSEEQENDELNDGIDRDDVVNNNINTKEVVTKSRNDDIISDNINEFDLIRDLYNGISDFKQNMPSYEAEFAKGCQAIKLDKKYEKEIEKSNKEKAKVKMIKPYNDWDSILSVPIMRIIGNMNDDGKMSGSDFSDAFANDGPMGLFKKKLLNDLEAKDDKGNIIAPPPMQAFLKKSIEGYENIVNNCGFAFNPTKLRSNLGIIIRDVGDVYENTPFFFKIITIIYNFFTFSNFFQDMTESKMLLKSLYYDIDLYYQAPFNERQKIIDSMNNKISRIEHLFSHTFLLKKETLEAIRTIKSDLNDSMSSHVDASDVVVLFIKTFGKSAVSKIDMSLVNKGAYNSILTKLASAIKDSTGLNEKDSNIVAQNILNNGNEKEIQKDIAMTEEQSKRIGMFFKGMVVQEYDKMLKELNQVGSFEDAKISINKNLQKVDVLTKTTDAINESMSLYINKCMGEIHDLVRKYRVLYSAGVSMDTKNVGAEIKGLKNLVLTSIKRVAGNYKDRLYEYIDNSFKRQEVLKQSNQNFEKLLESLTKAIKAKIYDKEGKNPKQGKEDEARELNDNMKDMKNLAGLCFASWESIEKNINNFEKEVNINVLDNFRAGHRSNNNLFKMINNKAYIENHVMNKMLNKGYVNTFRRSNFRNRF